MFKIIIILFLLLLLGGTITRRAIRVVAIAALILLLIKELRFIDINHASFSTACTDTCCQKLTLSDSGKQDIPISTEATLTLTTLFGGTIKATGWDKPFVRVAYTKHAGNQEDLDNVVIGVTTDAQEGAEAQTVAIVGDAEGSVWSSGDGWVSVSWSRSSWSGPVPCVDYELFVPQDKMKFIKCNARSGQIDIKSVVVSDTLHVHAHSGTIAIDGVNGNVHSKSHSGTISISSVTGSVGIDAKSGIVNAEHVQGAVSIKSRSGSIQLADIGGAVKAETKSGTICIKGAANNVQAETRSGAIVLDDVARAINASTRSGSITITRAPHAQGAVKASSQSGHVLVRDSSGDIVAEGRGQVVIK